MKPQKAIEILDLESQTLHTKVHPDYADAIKLGRDALKRLLTMRSYNIAQAILPLPSEGRCGGTQVNLDDFQRIKPSPLGRERG